MIVWIYGQPGAGKTTLANNLLNDFKIKGFGPWAHIDGDHIREIFENKDYSRNGRLANGTMAIKLCKYLESQGLNVMASLVTPYAETRVEIAKAFPDCVLIELEYETSENRRVPEYLVKDYENDLVSLDQFTGYSITINTSEATQEQALELSKVAIV